MKLNRIELVPFARFLKQELSATCEITPQHPSRPGIFLSACIDDRELLVYGLRRSDWLHVIMDDHELLNAIQLNWIMHKETGAFQDVDSPASAGGGS